MGVKRSWTKTTKSEAFEMNKEDIIKTLRDLAIFSAPIAIYALEQFVKTGTLDTELIYAFAMSTLVAGMRRYLTNYK